VGEGPPHKIYWLSNKQQQQWWWLMNGKTTTWLNDPAVLFRNRWWQKMVPRQDLSRAERANALARASIVAALLTTIVFGSPKAALLGVLGLLVSAAMLTKQPKTRAAPGASSVRRRRRKSAEKRQRRSEATEQPPEPVAMPVQFHDGTQGRSSAKGAVRPLDPIMGGSLSALGAAVGEVEFGQLPGPFPRPVTAGLLPPKFCPPSARPTIQLMSPQGLPDDTVNMFKTNSFTPRRMAPFAASPHLMQSPACRPATPDNPLGNPSIISNRVARPFRECEDADHRSEDQRFLNQLYRSTGASTADYAFLSFPVKNFVEETDSFRKWVYRDPQTHCRDRYSNPESSVDCFFDSIGGLGY